MEKNTNKPSIRFAEFTDAWEQRKLGDVVQITMGQSPDGSTYSDEPSDYILVQGNADLQNGWVCPRIWTTQITKKADAGDLIMSVRAPAGAMGKTAYNAVIGRGVAAIKGNEFIYQLLVKMDTDGFWKTLSCGSTFESLNSDNIKNAEVKIPTTAEQIKIGGLFQYLDNLITLHQRKCDQLGNIKKALLEKMFPSQNEYTPRIRFKCFTDAWEQRKLKDETSVITKQTGFDYSSTIKPSLVTEKNNDNYPFIQNKDFDGKSINYNTDFYIPISVAHKFPKITLDSPSLLITISGKIGNIGYFNDKTNAFIGGAVGICKLKNDNGSFITYSLLSSRGQRHFNSLVKASSHSNITIEDIRNIEYLCPSDNNEKLKIVKLFDNLDHLITLHQRKCEKLKNIKKSLLEKMFA